MRLHLAPPHGFAALLVVLAALLLPSIAHADGNVNFSYGWRYLDDDTWDPVDEQDVFGATVDFGGAKWPVNIAIGYYESEDDGTLASFPVFGDVDLEGEVSEWSLGAHKVWKLHGATRPFLGGGLTRVTGEARVESILGSVEEDDDSTGVYVEGGVFFRLAQVVNLGFHARIVEGTDVTLFGVDGDADYYQFGALLGFGWPQSK